MSAENSKAQDGTADKLSYEQKATRLEEILTRLDDSDTPIDELASDVTEGITLILEMNETLKRVDMQIKDAFKELDQLEESRETPNVT